MVQIGYHKCCESVCMRRLDVIVLDCARFGLRTPTSRHYEVPGSQARQTRSSRGAAPSTREAQRHRRCAGVLLSLARRCTSRVTDCPEDQRARNKRKSRVVIDIFIDGAGVLRNSGAGLITLPPNRSLGSNKRIFDSISKLLYFGAMRIFQLAEQFLDFVCQFCKAL